MRGIKAGNSQRARGAHLSGSGGQSEPQDSLHIAHGAPATKEQYGTLGYQELISSAKFQFIVSRESTKRYARIS